MVPLRFVAFAAVTAALLAGSGCKKARETPTNQTNIELPAPQIPPPAPVAPPVVQPKPAPKKAVVVPPSTEQPSAEEQMRDDAEATGMTSRVQSGNTANEPTTTPAGNDQN